MIRLTLTIDKQGDRCHFSVVGQQPAPGEPLPKPEEDLVAHQIGGFLQANFGLFYAAASYRRSHGIVQSEDRPAAPAAETPAPAAAEPAETPAEAPDPIPDTQAQAPTESANPPSGPDALEPGAEATPSAPADPEEDAPPPPPPPEIFERPDETNA